MRSVSLLFLTILFSYLPSFGQQRQEASTLSVYSENGEQFFLVINGINQNNIPSSRIRVEGLPKYDNDVQVLFADQRTPQIIKRVNIADPVDGKAVNMTLKIVRNREGRAILKFHECVEVNHNYHPQNDEYIMFYGRPQQAHPDREVQFIPLPQGPMAMDAQTFSDAKKSIADASFDETKLSTAKTILASNYVNTAQVMEICRLFSFEDNKLDFAKYAYSRTVDPGSYFKVGSLFAFNSNKEALNDFINKNHR